MRIARVRQERAQSFQSLEVAPGFRKKRTGGSSVWCMAEGPKGEAAASGRRQRGGERGVPEGLRLEVCSLVESLVEGIREEHEELRFEIGLRGRVLLQDQGALRRQLERIGASAGAFERVVAASQAAIEAVEQRMIALESRTARQERRLASAERQIRDLQSEHSGQRSAAAERRLEQAEERLEVAEKRLKLLSVLAGVESGVKRQENTSEFEPSAKRRKK